jgi:2-polyprenyl-3-methyl-5-hydroxy-6-metoxy-1,4-benzoquinol methylase
MRKMINNDILEIHWKKLSLVQENDFRSKSLSRLLIRQFPDAPCKVLDCGCGTGQLLITALNKGYDIQGIDISNEMAKTGKQILAEKGYNPDLIQTKGLLMGELEEYNGMFKIVILSDVLEHIESDVAALKETAQLCQNDGFILITVPAEPILFSERDLELGHYRRYDKVSLLTLISQAGLECVVLRKWNILGYFILRCLKILKRPFNEDFRLKQSPLDKAKAAILCAWFNTVEAISWRLPGVTLIAIAKRRKSCAE